MAGAGLSGTEAGLTGADAWSLVRSVRDPTLLEDVGVLHGRRVLLKREDAGPTGSFKWRGALCAIEDLRRRGVPGVVTASTGNHGAAVSWAARRLGLAAYVVVPRSATRAKCERIVQEGGTLFELGDDLAEASRCARELAREHDLFMLEDGALSSQLAGTETIARELPPGRLDAVIVPLACGALAGGLARGLARLDPSVVSIGVQVETHSRLSAVFAGLDDPGPEPTGTTFADGLADNRLVEPALGACREHLNHVVAVTDAELEMAVRDLAGRFRIRAEGAAGAPLAALARHGELVPEGRVALMVSGANIDAQTHARIAGG